MVADFDPECNGNGAYICKYLERREWKRGKKWINYKDDLQTAFTNENSHGATKVIPCLPWHIFYNNIVW